MSALHENSCDYDGRIRCTCSVSFRAEIVAALEGAERLLAEIFVPTQPKLVAIRAVLAKVRP